MPRRIIFWYLGHIQSYFFYMSVTKLFQHVSQIILTTWEKMTALEFSISFFNSQDFWAQDHRIKFSVVSKDLQLSCFWKRDYKVWPNYLQFTRKSKKIFFIFDTQKKFLYFFGKFWMFFYNFKNSYNLTGHVESRNRAIKLTKLRFRKIWTA